MSHAVKQILTELSAGVIEDTNILMERSHLGKLRVSCAARQTELSC